MWPQLLGLTLLCVSCAAQGPGEPSAGAASAVSSSTSTVHVVPTSTTTPVEEVAAMEIAEEESHQPSFVSSVRAVTAAELGLSWREGCPVSVGSLRRLDVTHWNDDAVAVTGAVVLHEDHVDAVAQAFSRLFDAGFAIHSLRPVSEYAADDDASMAANNSSAFNCREIAGSPGVWSQHAYGGAIDLNPLVNPWVRGSQVDPPAGAAYLDRTQSVTGMIVAGDVVTQAFAEIGWGWGGDWSSTKDYQHFSHNGR